MRQRKIFGLDGSELLLCFAMLGAGLYVLLSTLAMIARSWDPILVFDQWENLITGRHITLDWLLSQNYKVDHRLLFPRLLYLLDYWLAGETNLVNLAVSPMFQAMLLALMLAVKE